MLERIQRRDLYKHVGQTQPSITNAALDEVRPHTMMVVMATVARMPLNATFYPALTMLLARMTW